MRHRWHWEKRKWLAHIRNPTPESGERLGADYTSGGDYLIDPKNGPTQPIAEICTSSAAFAAAYGVGGGRWRGRTAGC